MPAKKPKKKSKKKKVTKTTEPKQRQYSMPRGGVDKKVETYKHKDLGDIPYSVWEAYFDKQKKRFTKRAEAYTWLRLRRKEWRDNHGDDIKRRNARDKIIKTIFKLKKLRPSLGERYAPKLDEALLSLSGITTAINTDGSIRRFKKRGK